MTTTSLCRAESIARLNDRARLGLDRTARIMITRAYLEMFSGDHPGGAIVAQVQLYRALRNHDFVNDAHGERDFGVFDFCGQRVMFKIDYYDLALEYGSEDPADASQTCRVITIMLPQDY